MQRKIKIAFVVLMLALVTKHVNAQYGLSAGISTQKFYGDASNYPMSFGLEVNGYKVFQEKVRAEAGIIYYLPAQFGDDNAYIKTGTFNLHVNGHYLFVGDFEKNEGFSLYGIVGLAINFYSQSTNIPGVTLSSSLGTNINLGLGAAYAVNDNIQLYFEPKLVIGTGSGNSRDGGTFSPGYTSWINIGARFQLGD